MQMFSIHSCKIRTARLLYILYTNPDIPSSVPYIGRYTLGELREHIADEYGKIYSVFTLKESCEELVFSQLADVYADRSYNIVLYTYRLTTLGRRIMRNLLRIAESQKDIAEKLTRASTSPNTFPI